MLCAGLKQMYIWSMAKARAWSAAQKTEGWLAGRRRGQRTLALTLVPANKAVTIQQRITLLHWVKYLWGYRHTRLYIHQKGRAVKKNSLTFAHAHQGLFLQPD